MTASEDYAVGVIATEMAMHYRDDGLSSAPIRCACGTTFADFTSWRRHTAEYVLDSLGLEEAVPAVTCGVAGCVYPEHNTGPLYRLTRENTDG